MKRFLISTVPFVLFLTYACGATPSTRRGPTNGEIVKTDKDVHEKLEQLHKVIDALQLTVKHMSDGHHKKTKEHSDKMSTKFKTLSAVISKLSKQNSALHNDNKLLRSEKNTLVDKISRLEVRLSKQAEEMNNIGAEAWMRTTAKELKAFLRDNGLEHFASPKFSPLIAGIVSNGVVIAPLALTSMFLLNYSKQLSTLRILMALNLFDVGFSIAVLMSSVLLLGDPFEGMRHISEVNFVFIQLVVATVFWITVCFLIAAIVRNRKNRGWRYAAIELWLRVGIAVDYTSRVWIPVMERDHLPIALPPLVYIIYVVSALVAAKLTSLANKYAISEYHQVERREEDPAIMVSVVSQRSS